MQSLPITRTTYPISRTLVLTLLLVAITAMVTIPGVARAQINPQLNISVSQDLQNWPLKSGTGVRAGLPTDVVYYVTDTTANNALNARYWNQNYVPKSPSDTGRGMQNYIISQGTTTLLGKTVSYPTGALPSNFLIPQPSESESYLYYVTGASLFGPPVTEVDSEVLTASYTKLANLQGLKGWSF